MKVFFTGRHGLLLGSAVAVLALTLTSPAHAFDPFDVLRTNKLISATPSGYAPSADVSRAPCNLDRRPSPLDLHSAVEWALCSNPKTAEAWANIKVQAAGVGIGRAAYLPTITASGQEQREKSSTTFNGVSPLYNSGYSALVRSETVSLNWVLYDFGGRSAALKNAKELLSAACANRDVTLQDVLLTVAKDYYAAQAAQGMLDSTRELEHRAKQTADVALMRVTKGIAPISDQLQAQTSYTQTIFKRVKAEGELQVALGVLAADMDLKPSEPLTVPSVEDGGTVPDAQFSASVSELIDTAKRTHPSILAAQSQLNAAIAKEDIALAQGLPQLSLVARYSNNRQPANLGVGADSFYPATARDKYIGIQLNIPLFEGFGRVYQVRQARAQSEVQRAILSEAEQKAGIDVWKSYQYLQTSTQNLETTAMLVKIAEQSFVAVRSRYRAGVGSIIEILNVQASLADAKQQRVQALTDWRVARLDLAAKLGTLSMQDI
jgi:outer membrane protein